MSPLDVVTAICTDCGQAVEAALFAPEVGESTVSPRAIHDHAAATGHMPAWFHFIKATDRRKEAR